MSYKLLAAFEALFSGKQYIHRDSSRGDWIAVQLYEDLVDLNRSTKLASRISTRTRVRNQANKQVGIKARRGDGTFGELVPGESAILDPGYKVAHGMVATIEIGTEVKILAKAMIKQIDRVISDLQKQVAQFKTGGGLPICVGIVGINHAAHYTGYEKDRTYKTTGTGGFSHPVQEAAKAEARLLASVQSHYDELVVLRFDATNEEPFPFSWVNPSLTAQEYAAALVRIIREYERRF